MAVSSKYFSGSEKAHDEHHEEEHDPRIPDVRSATAEMNQMVMESMLTSSWRFWVVFGFWHFWLPPALSMPGGI